MRNTIIKNLNDENYKKWRLENPPGGKSIKYIGLKFRSTQEASNYCKVSRSTISRHIKQKKKGCKKLNPNKIHDYLIKY